MVPFPSNVRESPISRQFFQWRLMVKHGKSEGQFWPGTWKATVQARKGFFMPKWQCGHCHFGRLQSLAWIGKMPVHGAWRNAEQARGLKLVTRALLDCRLHQSLRGL